MQMSIPKRTFQTRGLMPTNEAEQAVIIGAMTELDIVLVLAMDQIMRWAPKRTDR